MTITITPQTCHDRVGLGSQTTQIKWNQHISNDFSLINNITVHATTEQW